MPDPDFSYKKGEYCVDLDVNYNEGDQFKEINNVDSPEQCRQLCVSEPQCQYYVWSGSKCSLKGSSLWIPRLESGTVSGSIHGLCSSQNIDEYGFCECVELAPDYYDPDFVDLVETGLINERSNVCPADHGKRCFSREADPGTSSRIFFGN